MTVRTKIVATLGPASEGSDAVEALARAGCDIFRINCSHGTEEQHAAAYESVRNAESTLGRPLAVLVDLCGPKVRVGELDGGSVELVEGEDLAIQRAPVEGTAKRISTTLGEIVDVVRPGETILLDDGRIRLEVVSTSPPAQVTCRVTRGGVLLPGKGINLPQTRLLAPALTENDRRCIEWCAEREVDFVALSFVRTPQDVTALHRLLEERGSRARVIAKIEKPEALEHIAGIVDRADAVMVARGDLGVEMELPAVPVVQKRIARLCHEAGKCCIIATQMLETMTQATMPTRAEVSDVANAVLDLADAVMLSGETAVGKHPVEAARMMRDIVSHVQAYHDETRVASPVVYAPAATAAALGNAVGGIVAELDTAAVGVFTATGTTARMLAKNRLPCPIIALSPDPSTVRRMCLYYGVVPELAGRPEHTREVLAMVSRTALERGIAEPGQRVVVISGRPIGEPGATSTLVVHTIARG
jgi:pyruvate kinase